MLTGEYRIALDEKGRILVPSKLRADIPGNLLYVTRGLEGCVWLLLPDFFNRIRDQIMNDSMGAVFDKNLRLLQRYVISPSVETEFDKSGRIMIPQSLREGAQLVVKEECTLTGVVQYMELWNTEVYRKYLEASGGDAFEDAAQSLSDLLRGAK